MTCVVITVAGCQGDSEAPRGAPATSAPTPTRTPEPSATKKLRSSTLQPDGPGRGGSAQAEPSLTQRQLNARLIAAAWANDLRRARRLIEAGADVNAKDETEQSAYLVATSEGYLRLLELTLRNGADVHSLDSFNGTGLIRAAERGHADVVARLLQTDIRVNHVNRLGWTALHEAIILGDGSQRYVDTVRLLVAGGADVDLPSERDGVTPLQHARSRGYDEIAALLTRR
jgi:hypothetical protein